MQLEILISFSGTWGYIGQGWRVYMACDTDYDMPCHALKMFLVGM